MTTSLWQHQRDNTNATTSMWQQQCDNINVTTSLWQQQCDNSSVIKMWQRLRVPCSPVLGLFCVTRGCCCGLLGKRRRAERPWSPHLSSLCSCSVSLQHATAPANCLVMQWLLFITTALITKNLSLHRVVLTWEDHCSQMLRWFPTSLSLHWERPCKGCLFILTGHCKKEQKRKEESVPSGVMTGASVSRDSC